MRGGLLILVAKSIFLWFDIYMFEVVDFNTHLLLVLAIPLLRGVI